MLAILRQLRDLTEAQRGEPVPGLALERALHVAAGVVLDVGHHVLAGRGQPIPGTYREVLPALGRAGVVGADLVERLDGLAGLRNLLVHDYADIDRDRLWDLVDRRLDDLAAAQAAFASLPELSSR
ncbi:MAG: HepT-like ribonuclease domain-containing protein [Planctomycetota bacterium]